MTTFLVLTGFFAARSLVPALQAACTPGGRGPAWAVLSYWATRARRVLPTLHASLALAASLLALRGRVSPAAARGFYESWAPFPADGCGPRGRGLLRPALLLPSPPFRGCAVHTWTLVVQVGWAGGGVVGVWRGVNGQPAKLGGRDLCASQHPPDPLPLSRPTFGSSSPSSCWPYAPPPPASGGGSPWHAPRRRLPAWRAARLSSRQGPSCCPSPALALATLARRTP